MQSTLSCTADTQDEDLWWSDSRALARCLFIARFKTPQRPQSQKIVTEKGSLLAFNLAAPDRFPMDAKVKRSGTTRHVMRERSEAPRRARAALEPVNPESPRVLLVKGARPLHLSVAPSPSLHDPHRSGRSSPRFPCLPLRRSSLASPLRRSALGLRCSKSAVGSSSDGQPVKPAGTRVAA